MLQLHTNKVTPGQDTEMENEDEDSAGSVATPVEESSEDENDEESQYERSDDETDDNHLYYIWQNDTQELFTEFIKENQIRQNKTKVTKSYGEIEFDEDRTNSLYIRVHSGTKDELMWKLMTEIWQMDTPKLLISISGESDSKNTTLLKALVETARENHAWIITDGSLALENCGYIYLLGIAKWSILSGKQCLEGTDECQIQWNNKDAYSMLSYEQGLEKRAVSAPLTMAATLQHSTNVTTGTGQWPAKYEGGQIQDSGVKLDENHTHFILVDDDDDDDDDDDGDGDVKYHPSKREKIEVNRPGDLKQIPLVLIVVNGDCSTLHRLLYHASEHTPAIVVEGSGGIADIVARTLQNEGSCDEATIGQIIEEKRGIENKEENDKIKEMVNDIQEYKTNLTSFQLKNDIDSENISSAIDDAIAKEKDFPKLESRLVSNSVEKVEHFLKDGLNLKKFLTPERLVTLYKKSLDSNEKNNARFSTRRILRERYKIFSNSTGSRDNRLTPLRNVMKKLVHDINKDLYKDNKLSDLPETDLFLWALIMNRQRMALCFWKELDNGNIGAALIASRMLTALAETADDIEEHALSKILLQNANDFQDLAIGVLDTCYSTKRQLSEDGLVRKLKQWNNTTCLSIANVSKQMRFVEHECCQVFLQSNWKGKLVINTTFQWIKFFLALLFPIIFVFGITITGEKTERKYRYPVMWKLKCFFTSPITKFAYNCISYLILLGVFSWFILTDLRPVSEPNSPSIKEWIVIAWVCTLFVEEIRQLVIRDAQSARHMLEEWISEGWNILDCSMFVSFTLAVSLRFVLPNDKFTFARIFYCLSLMLFYFRLLQMGLVHKHIGPKIIMIYEMLKDLLSFMLILAVFILSFGIAIEGILYPNLDSSPLVFVKALYKPYWQLYGEIFLDEVEGLVNSETCGDDPRLIDTCPSYTWIVPVLTAVYMLFSNILLINLIIAIFSYSIQTVLENSRTLWYFHRYDLIKEYIEKPPFPAPLVIFAVAYEFIVYPSRCIHEIKKLHPLQRHLSHEENVRLNKFEKQCTDEYNKKLTMKTTSSAGQRFFTRVKKSKNVNDALGLIIRYTDDRLDKMFEDIKEMVAGKKDEQIVMNNEPHV